MDCDYRRRHRCSWPNAWLRNYAHNVLASTIHLTRTLQPTCYPHDYSTVTEDRKCFDGSSHHRVARTRLNFALGFLMCVVIWGPHGVASGDDGGAAKEPQNSPEHRGGARSLAHDISGVMPNAESLPRRVRQARWRARSQASHRNQRRSSHRGGKTCYSPIVENVYDCPPRPEKKAPLKKTCGPLVVCGILCA
jgi:hypothetical protein